MADKASVTKRRRRIPTPDYDNCERVDPTRSLKFILGIDTDLWVIKDIYCGVQNDVKVTHFNLEFTGTPGICPECGEPMKFHDRKERSWRHANLDATVCYIHADVPRCQCGKCNRISQVPIPWADPMVSYTKRFEEIAIEHMSQMSLAATSRLLMVSWKLLDDIVDRKVKVYLANMDLSKVRRIRVDETSAKKHHKYITIITDVDTGNVIFITKGKDSRVMAEFSKWLVEHNGNPENIELVATDFGEAFINGTREFLPNAESVLDPFHLIQIANRHLDRDRASCQVNGERKKSIRYAMLKNPENLTDPEKAALMDFTKDHEKAAVSYQMKESLRQVFSYSSEDAVLAKNHLEQWSEWAAEEGSNGFKALAKTVKRYILDIVRAVETGINNGYQESLNGRVQLSKALGRGYKREMRLGRIVIFRDIYRAY